MEALTPASETSRQTEVMALPAALRPATGAGVPLSTLAAQVGAVPAEGSATSDLPITGVTLRAQDVQPGDLFAALPGGATHGARFFRRRDRTWGRRGAHRRVWVGAAEPRRRRGARPRPSRTSQRSGRARRHRVRASVRAPGRHRRHRDVGQDDDDLPDRSRSAVGRADGGADRHRRAAYQRRRHPERADHARGACAAGPAGGDGRARRRHRGDGGVQSRADAGPRRRHSLRGGRFHQPVPRSPRLPPDDGGLLRGQGAVVRPGIAVARPPRSGVRRRRCRPLDGPPRRQGDDCQHEGSACGLARRRRHG